MSATFSNATLPAVNAQVSSIGVQSGAQAPQLEVSLGVDLQLMMKRVIDIVIAGFGLICISPLLLVIALLVKLTSEGPVFYKSHRIGKNYEPFYMLKFRTMNPNADALRDELRKACQLEDGLFKMENDPRITPVGRFLRKYSLDELPQLINVLKGEMSLVGPRPLPEDESSLFEHPYTYRYSVQPGITGLWQVSGRSNLNFKTLCDLELRYVMCWSLLMDLRILMQTPAAVFQSRGAC